MSRFLGLRAKISSLNLHHHLLSKSPKPPANLPKIPPFTTFPLSPRIPNPSPIAFSNLGNIKTLTGNSRNFSTQGPELRHQEIVGPTVERDDSALANETRSVLEDLGKSIYKLSSALAVLGVANLGLGAWIVYSVRPPDEVSVLGLAAFAFPFSMAFLMRRTVKPIAFFRKMEDQGRLQVLTLALQVSKNVNQLFLRTRVIAYCCAVGVSAGSLVAIFVR